jgi:hypothetical protein
MTTSRDLSLLVPLPTGTGPYAWKPSVGWTSDFGSLFRVENVQATSVGQTVFTIPNGYSLPLVLAYFNGVLLLPSEYTATNGTTVTLVRGADATSDVLTACVLYAVPASGDALLSYTTATLPAASTNTAHIYWNSDLPGPVYSNGSSWLPLAGAGLGTVAVENVVPIAKGGTSATTVADAQAALGINRATNIVAGTDLNTLQATGPYLQQANASATLALNYPVASAGSLAIINLGSITTQVYIAYDTGTAYSRSRYVSSWSAWTAGSGPFSQEYVSAQQTITPGGTITLAHGLGVVPKLILCQVVCVVANSGYAVGDVVDNIPIQYFAVNATSAMRGVSVQKDATSIIAQYGSYGGPTIVGMVKGTGATGAFTDTSWRLVVRAYA